MFGPLISRTILTPPLIGTAFRNSAERLAYRRGVAQQEARIKARIADDAKLREYEDCRRVGRDNCHHPGQPPP